MRQDVIIAVRIVLLAVFAAGCSSIGPQTIPRDQFNYGTAISEAWKEQLLFNIVGLRYIESPVFVSLSSVINQYSLEGQVSVGGGLNTAFGGDNNTVTAGGSGRYRDQPTITYTPLTGEKFARSLLTPIPPESLFALFQSGAAPEFLLRLTVRRLNGINNSRASPTTRRDADPEFTQVLAAWGRLRDAGVIGFRRVEEGESARIIVSQHRVPVAKEVEADLAFFFKSLGLDPSESDFELVYGLVSQQSNQITILTSSIFDIMHEMAWRIDVPAIHIEEGRTGLAFRESNPAVAPLINVYSSAEQPEDEFVSIKMRGHWYYISDRDIPSKRSFSILQLMLNLTDSGDAALGPIVSISN